MVFAALVCWHGSTVESACHWPVAITDWRSGIKPLTEAANWHNTFSNWQASPNPWLSQEHLWRAVRQSEPPFSGCSAKTPPKDPSWCDHHMYAMLWMSSSQTKPYTKPLQQQLSQNGINWPNSHFPVESVPTLFPFLHLCSLLHTLVINHVVGMCLSESLSKWMQLIHSEKAHFLFLGYQKLQETALTGSRRPWEGTEENRDGAQEIVGAMSECGKRAEDSCLLLGQEWAIRPAQ